VVAVGVVLFLTLLNCRGVQQGKIVQNIFTVAKTLALILLIIVGLTIAANPDVVKQNFQDLWSGATATEKYQQITEMVPVGGLVGVLLVAGGAMVGSLFSADAWANVTFTAGEVQNPRRNLPLSLILGAGGVIVLYLLANVAYLSALRIDPDAALAADLRRI